MKRLWKLNHTYMPYIRSVSEHAPTLCFCVVHISSYEFGRSKSNILKKVGEVNLFFIQTKVELWSCTQCVCIAKNWFQPYEIIEIIRFLLIASYQTLTGFGNLFCIIMTVVFRA